jgi:hypothetical protein
MMPNPVAIDLKAAGVDAPKAAAVDLIPNVKPGADKGGRLAGRAAGA